MANDLLFTSEFVCFTTRDYASASNLLIPSASRTLSQLAERGILTRVTKGIWANTKHPYFSPLACVPLLLGPEQGYISFLTALHRQGAISQIPPAIQVATTGHSRKKRTPVGTFEFFQLKPQMMLAGVDWADAKSAYRIASCEKALLDTLYLSTRKSNRFSVLPEVEFKFNKKTVHTLLNKQVTNRNIRIAILKKLESAGFVLRP